MTGNVIKKVLEHHNISPKTIKHYSRDVIGLYFSADKKLNELVKKSGGKWSASCKCWYLPKNKILLQNLADRLSQNSGYRIDERYETKTLIPAAQAEKYSKNVSRIKNISELAEAKIIKHTTAISTENDDALLQYKNALSLKAYSPNTIKTYSNEFYSFLQTLQHGSAKNLDSQQLQRYILYCINTLKLQENTIHSRMNALKFYYEQVLHKPKMFFDIPRPKKQLQLPKVISKEQIAMLINAIENTKHKTIIMLAYACGLRVSEVVSLKVKSIDGQRKIIFINNAKGKKDRVVSLSPAMLIMLREYYKQYKPAYYLFEGQFKNEHLSSRSIQQVLQKAKEKAGIKQDGSMHMLRHSFATHLLDKGIDVVFIQKLLGHNDIKTTLKYLHVTNKDLIHIISPLEDIEKLLKK